MSHFFQFNDKLSWFLNGQLVADGISFTASSSYNVKLGPRKGDK
jgi:hypothetical protein